MPKFERKVEIDATVEKVWQVMTDPQHWPQWFPGVDSVSNVTTASEGGSIDWTNASGTGKALIVKMVPMKHLEVMTQMGDDKDSHVFNLQPSGGFLGMGANECQVDYTLDTLMGGGLLASFVAGGNPKDMLRVTKAMNLLRKLVESL